MVIEVISPTLQVLADQRVMPSELTWYAQELMWILIGAAVMSALWGLLMEAARW